MVDNADKVKLLDFGLSKTTKGIKDQNIVGTNYFMAPEMVVGDYYDS